MRQRSLQHYFWLLLSICWCFQACCPIPQKRLGHHAYFVQALDFEYLKIEANVAYQDHTHRRGSAHVKLRIKKDQLIWFSVLGPWGIEILRGIATPVSITLLDRMKKTCTVYDYETLGARWPGPWDYMFIQAVLLGELAHAYDPHEVVQQNSQQSVIQQQKEVWTLTHFINPTLKKIEKLVATARQSSFVATYNQFKPCQGGLLFGRATLTWYCYTTSAQPALTLVLKGMQVQRSTKPLHFPFAMPTQYEKK
jgi:Domain of unknown function (DUF4292)